MALAPFQLSDPPASLHLISGVWGGAVAAPGRGNLELSIYLSWGPVCRPLCHRHTAKSTRGKKRVEIAQEQKKKKDHYTGGRGDE